MFGEDIHFPEGYDLYCKTRKDKNDGNALAYAGPTIRHIDSHRPILGDITVVPFGDHNFLMAADSVNQAFGTILHEFLHVVAFISLDEMHKSYVLKDKTIDQFLWTGPRVLEVAREYYNCDSIKGVPLQNLDGSVGGHWSETFMSYEVMTPSSGVESEA